jgi:membrane protease YdiL (CAAX protease family)
MKHLESAFAGKNSLWRYAVMLVAVFIAINTIGGIPLYVSMITEAATSPDSLLQLSKNPSDLSILGIGPLEGLVMMLFPFLVGIFAFRILFKPLHLRHFNNVINGTSSIRWNRIVVSALVWTTISLIYLFIYKGFDPSNFKLNNISSSLYILVAISLLLIPFQASFEEVIFRGYLMQGFAVLVKNRWLPLILTSLGFGLLHLPNPEVKEFGLLAMLPQYVMFGLLFGITTILDDGIEIALGAHTANNIFLSIMVTNSSSTLQTPAVFEQLEIMPWIEFGGLILSSLLFLFVMGRLFNWGSFRVLLGRLSQEEGQNYSP